ncbi:hypothetical protein [Thermogymnomonas acidicola]|uniref:hypothetical protein n=1 Tax=Thermogymnomonas acidicola TaxID=399579 RepID=UPI00139696C6|nr:hypothetical protein [Thermogymnomonas acidicola]
MMKDRCGIYIGVALVAFVLPASFSLTAVSSTGTHAERTADSAPPTPPIMYYSINHPEKYGNIYVQYWAYLGPHGEHVYWYGIVHVTAENGAVLDGGYPFWNEYDVIGSHSTGTIDFTSPDASVGSPQSIYAFTPPENTISSGSAETVTFGFSASAGYAGVSAGGTIQWQVNYPEFEEVATSLTATDGAWAFYDNQALNGPNPTAASFSAGVAVPVVKYNAQSIDSSCSMTALLSEWGGLWITAHTYSVTKYLFTEYIS